MRFLSVLFVAVLSCQIANGQPTSQELITKFRKAMGSEAAKGSIPYLIHYRGERYLYSLRDGRLLGESFPFDGKLYGYTDKRHMHRKEWVMKIGIVPLKVVEVINGDAGWYQLNEGEAVAMSKGEIEGRAQRELHVEVFLGNDPFDPALWQFSEPKSTQVRGQDVWMFEAKTKGPEPFTLYFAKQSGFLLRLKSKAMDFAWLPSEKPKLESFTRDLYFRDWKKFGARILPGHFEAFHDGILWQQMEAVGVSFLDTIDAKMFAAPESTK
jgi:hypothetical protein